MKVTISKSKNQKIYYISKSIRLNGKSTTRTVEKLGTEEEVRKRADGMDPYEWAKQYAAELTRKEKESGEAIRYSPTRLIRKNAIQTINISYLFAQDIYYDLRINELCDSMTEQYSLPFDFNSVFSRLIYTRIIYHASKRGTYQLSKNSVLGIENNTGTELPSTGGIGTTIFYIVGGLLAVSAGVVLITKKIMSREEK